MPQTTGAPGDRPADERALLGPALTLGRLSVETQGDGRLRPHRPAPRHWSIRPRPADRRDLRAGAHGGDPGDPGAGSCTIHFRRVVYRSGLHRPGRRRTSAPLSHTAPNFDSHGSRRATRTAWPRGRERARGSRRPSRAGRTGRRAGWPRRHGDRRAVRAHRRDRRYGSFRGRHGDDRDDGAGQPGH